MQAHEDRAEYKMSVLGHKGCLWQYTAVTARGPASEKAGLPICSFQNLKKESNPTRGINPGF